MRYKLEKSTRQENWWVLADLDNLVVIRFEQGKFNETQEVSLLDESSLINDKDCANKLAQIMREMGDYLSKHHICVALDSVYGFEYSEDDTTLFLCRYKFPVWRLEITDRVDSSKLAATLRKAAEWLSKR